MLILHLVAMNAEGQILGHEAALHSIDTSLLQGGAELGQSRVVVQLGTINRKSESKKGKEKNDDEKRRNR